MEIAIKTNKELIHLDKERDYQYFMDKAIVLLCVERQSFVHVAEEQSFI